MSLFEDVVVFLGRSKSVDELAAEVDVKSREAVRVAVVLSLPVVIANLAKWVEDPVGAYWLTARLADVGTLPVDNFGALSQHHQVEDMGRGLLELMFTEGWNEVSERIALRAKITPSSADGILVASAASVLVHLAGRHGDGASRAVLLSELNEERQDLVEGGWEPWMAETMAHGQLSVAPAPRQSTVVSSPINEEERSERPPVLPAPERSAHLGVSTDPMIDALVEPPSDGGPLHALPQVLRQPAGLALLVGLVLAAVLLLAVVLSSGSDDTAQSADLVDDASGAQDAAAGESTGDQTGDQYAGEGEEADDGYDQVAAGKADEADSGADAAGGGAETSGDSSASSANGDVVTVDVAMDDPLGRIVGTGTATVTFDKVSGEVCYDFGVEGVGNPYDGHVHVGPAGVKGGIVIDFGELSGSPSDCFVANPVDVNAILTDLPGHYVEFHDPDGVNTIRAQLAAPVGAEAASASGQFDTDSGGAVIVIEAGALVLRGDVPDQVTVDKLIETFADIDLGPSQLVDELTIVPGAPRPSGRILVDDDVLFDFNSDELTDPDSTVINDVATVFKARPAWRLAVVGHTDGTGSDVYNLELSLRRASAVRDALVAAGVSSDALTIEGAGSTDPVASNATVAGRAQNRRIEFEITAG